MPMVYVSKETSVLIERILKVLQKNTSAPSRVLKADVIRAAVEEYAKKLDLKQSGKVK